MTYKNNNFFDFLNYIFKSSDKDVKDYVPSVYLTNRWVSMANPLLAKVVNLTVNKWILSKHTFDVKKFYRVVLPYNNSKINYIKKPEKTKNQDDNDLEMAALMECSHRELNIFKETIEFLNNKNK
jgi:hypothetical protein